MSISVSDLQKLQDIVNEQLKSAGSSIEGIGNGAALQPVLVLMN